ncbi:ASKHA domain-containing protein [Sporomusa aerivorans]|uniref:ASKHA domain-containing protein n=1 Tax=Sporomusa aerivorans TaxID=204936 RepID=UPI00352A2939
MDADITYNLLIAGNDRCFTCKKDKTILQALVDCGVFIEANCGGRGTCGRCKIQVLSGQVTTQTGQPVQPGPDKTYLACQVYPRGDITILLNKAAVSSKGQNIEIGIAEETPLVKKVVLTPVYPTVDNHYSLQDMLQQALASQTSDPRLGASLRFFDQAAILRRLAAVVETQPERITLTLLDSQLIAVETGDTSGRLYGVAFDVGTTTVVGMLADIKAGKVIAVCSKNNPQASMGADVISRIQATHELEGGLERLSQLIRICLNQIIAELCGMANIALHDIYTVTVAGNATMSHLALEISPSTLVRKPYAALFKYIAPLDPTELELSINKQGKVIILPNIASFVGSDTTAAILAIEQDIADKPLLLVDLGTNGEMVIGDGKRLYACSTAAGPAFEGAYIRDGMRAAEGAITDVVITGEDVLIQVIGNVKPVGICGSGIVKAVAELVKTGVLAANGRFNTAAGGLPLSIRERLKKRDGQWEFVLVAAKDSAGGADISITQADVRQIQLVKSSICTGIEFLQERLSARHELKVCLAGAFGNYIDIESAVIIGMLPGVRPECIYSVGNAAGTGAVQTLLSAERMQRCIAIAAKVNYVELAAQPGFQNGFLKNLSFPRYCPQ